MYFALLTSVKQIVGDETKAIDSVLKADVWRDHLLQQERELNARLAELETAGDTKADEELRDEVSGRLAEVHARLAEMDAESGPARAAHLLAGMTTNVLDMKRRKTQWSHNRARLHRRRSTSTYQGVQWRLEVGTHIFSRRSVIISLQDASCARARVVCQGSSRVRIVLCTHLILQRSHHFFYWTNRRITVSFLHSWA